MAIKKAISIQFDCVGDGAAQTVAVSLSDDPMAVYVSGIPVTNSFVTDKHASKPVGVVLSTPAGASGSLSGDTLTVDFGRVLASGEMTSVTALLLF